MSQSRIEFKYGYHIVNRHMGVHKGTNLGGDVDPNLVQRLICSLCLSSVRPFVHHITVGVISLAVAMETAVKLL